MFGSAIDKLPAAQRHQLQRLLTAPAKGDLDWLARVYRTDKSSRQHGYTQWYAHHLPARREVSRVLEIGVGGTTSRQGFETPDGGASLRMWQAYFPLATIVGLDIERKEVRGPRIVVERGSQDDPAVLKSIGARHGPFDVIVDDGSHLGRHQRSSLEGLWGELRPGGVYVVEDLATSYWPAFDGGPPGTPDTGVTLIQAQVHRLMLRQWQAAAVQDEISELHVYNGIAFLVKSD